MNCLDNSFHDYICKCADTILFNVNVDPGADYHYVITDKFGNKFSADITSDGDGQISIPVNQLPEGLFTQYSGTFSFELYMDNTLCTPVLLNMKRKYREALFHVEPGNFEKSNVGC